MSKPAFGLLASPLDHGTAPMESCRSYLVTNFISVIRGSLIRHTVHVDL